MRWKLLNTVIALGNIFFCYLIMVNKEDFVIKYIRNRFKKILPQTTTTQTALCDFRTNFE